MQFQGLPGQVYNTRGASYTGDSTTGVVTVTNPSGYDIQDLIAMGLPPISTGKLNTPLLVNFRNLIDGGDFQTNPWQRGTSIASISNTVTYGPDRFFAIGGASSNITLAKAANTDVPGFTQACTFGRTSGNTDVAAINYGQVLESLDCYRCQGQQVTFSFWAKQGANYSGGAVTVKVYSGTAADGSAANMVTGSWTGSATPISSTFTPTTVMTRYQFTASIPATVLQLGVLLTYTPVGTAGSADNLVMLGFQLEVAPSATLFEFRDAEVELALAQRYFFQINEPAAGVIVGSGMISATNAQTVFIPLPVQMRAAPTVTVVAGGFRFNIAGTATAVGGGFAGGSTHTPNYISVVGTVTATVGQATLLQGNGSTGTIKASADY